MQKFKINSNYQPAGDQPQAIEKICKFINLGSKNQVLLGVTGSGKTFTMAQVINKLHRPTIIMAHNKTLAAQIYGEMKELFPENAVEYFVSYYDYYQPEAYLPRTDTFIEKDSSINEQIDLMRHSATRSLLERRDVIVVSSVSCIYGLGSPDLYYEMIIELKVGQKIDRNELARKLINIQYERNDVEFTRGKFRIRGDTLDILPSHYSDRAWRINFFGDEIDEMFEIDALTGKKSAKLDKAVIFANSHYVTPRHIMEKAVIQIKDDLKTRLSYYHAENKLLEYARLDQRTKYDIEMILETGTCKGIENYSRYLTGRKEGSPPPTLFEYLPKDALLFIDESHVTIPQVHAMYNGDRSRKSTLVEHGFRLPSALDNRPLKFEEWDAMRPQTLYVSATPSPYELDLSQNNVAEQIIRPTGLIDPICEIRPATNQVDDLIAECQDNVAKGERVLVTTLTKKMAENLTEYLKEVGLKVVYLHSEIKTLERIEIIRGLRQGEHDILVGINLLREGLDIPECSLVAILDADKEGFLRSATSLIQTIGRAARNASGRVILYADNITKSIEKAISETSRRRKIQEEYNLQHGITPETIKKSISQIMSSIYEKDSKLISTEGNVIDVENIPKHIEKLRKAMFKLASELEFEKAGKLRDEIKKLEENYLTS